MAASDVAARENLTRLTECWANGPFDEDDPCNETCIARKSENRSYRLLESSAQTCGLAAGARIGQGGFGRVFDVFESATGRTHVLKVVEITTSLSSYPFMEVEVLARVITCHTPFLVDLVSPGQCPDLQFPPPKARDAGRVGIVISKAARSLHNLIKDSAVPISAERLLQLIFSMLMSVFSLHSCGILHMDIKPDNFLCSNDGTSASLTDFGLSKYIAPETPGFQLEGNVGTQGYRAPEISGQGPQMASKKSDAFALGIAIAELILKPDARTSGSRGAGFGGRYRDPVANAVFDRRLAGTETAFGARLGQGFDRFRAGGGRAYSGAAVAQLITNVVELSNQNPASRPELEDIINLEIFARIRDKDDEEAVLMSVPAQYDVQESALIRQATDFLRDTIRNYQGEPELDAVTPAGLVVLADLYRRLMNEVERAGDAALTGLHLFLPRDYWPMLTFRFAVLAVAQCFPQSGMGAFAREIKKKLPLDPETLEGEVFVAIAHLCDFMFVDLTLLNAFHDETDMWQFWPLALNPGYLTVRSRLLSVLVQLRAAAELSPPTAEVGDPSYLFAPGGLEAIFMPNERIAATNKFIGELMRRFVA